MFPSHLCVLALSRGGWSLTFVVQTMLPSSHSILGSRAWDLGVGVRIRTRIGVGMDLSLKAFDHIQRADGGVDLCLQRGGEKHPTGVDDKFHHLNIQLFKETKKLKHKIVRILHEDY